MRIDGLIKFIKEREAIRLRKEADLPRPWTDDEILNMYRFCNVRRNDDTVTKWIHENWLRPWAGYEDLWFTMFVARLINAPENLRRIEPYALPFHAANMRSAIRRMKNPTNPAYKVMSPLGAGHDRASYIVDVILSPLWKDRERLRPSKYDSLDVYHMTLEQHPGVGSFLAAQVIADLKYVEPLKSAPDWTWWAASGPGSRRGLGYVIHGDLNRHYGETKWRHEFFGLWQEVNNELNWREPLTGQDLQNCLCEYSKYIKAVTGQGRPKQLYRPSDETKSQVR